MCPESVLFQKKEIQPGTEVFITLKHTSRYILKGIVMWSSHIYNEFENFYRMGIETNSIIHSDIQAVQFSEKSDLITEIISQIAKQDGSLLGILTQ